MQTVADASATMYAPALMKIMVRYGISHMLVLDKDNKFFNVLKEVVDLLQLNCRVLSAHNHNDMLVERINLYLNKDL